MNKSIILCKTSPVYFVKQHFMKKSRTQLVDLIFCFSNARAIRQSAGHNSLPTSKKERKSVA